MIPDRSESPSQPKPVPRWLVPAVAGLAVASLAVVIRLVSQTGDEPTGHYRGHGITFRYPPQWDLLPEVEESIVPGGPGPAYVIRLGREPPLDVVFITEYGVDDLPPGDSMGDRLQQALDEFQEATGLEVVEPIQRFDDPRVEAYTARLAGAMEETVFQSLVFYVVDGRRLWAVSCQSTPPHRSEMEGGCWRIVTSLR